MPAIKGLFRRNDPLERPTRPPEFPAKDQKEAQSVTYVLTEPLKTENLQNPELQKIFQIMKSSVLFQDGF